MRRRSSDPTRASGTRRVRKVPPSGAGASGSSTFEENFGPGLKEESSARDAGSHRRPPRPGPFPGLACAGENCLLKPAADLLEKFALGLGRRGHGVSLSRAALSGIGFMKALRDFLDEEIALAERAAAGGGARPRYEKIEVE